ncbi:MAG: hypothetical protein LBU79_06215 [Planctomycetota bacterium]|jgi:F0F1-type ATP synthase membrane subunit b/b'|nr:hypothetical protein [Planctomycetota bacterium]
MDYSGSGGDARLDEIIRSAQATQKNNSNQAWRSILDSLRKTYLFLAILLFLLYAWASVAYQNQVDVPQFHNQEIDLLGGMTRAEFDAQGDSQFIILMQLENRHYQLTLEESFTDANGKAIASDRPLTASDYSAIIASFPPEAKPKLQVRNPADIYALVGLNYHLRDPVYDPHNPFGNPLINHAEPVTRELIVRLQELGVSHITVSGIDAPVKFEAGTALMVGLIFLALVAALKPALWDPFLALIERRQLEITQGADAARHNQEESERLTAERNSRQGQIVRKIQAERLRQEQEASNQADSIMQEAQKEEKALRLQEMRELTQQATVVASNLQEEVAPLAREIAHSLLGREPK